MAGYLFCSGANRLQLIIANLGACSEGGVSSLSSNPLASSRLYLLDIVFNINVENIPSQLSKFPVDFRQLNNPLKD